jgi:hypothetical protein
VRSAEATLYGPARRYVSARALTTASGTYRAEAKLSASAIRLVRCSDRWPDRLRTALIAAARYLCGLAQFLLKLWVPMECLSLFMLGNFTRHRIYYRREMQESRYAGRALHGLLIARHR